MSARLHWTIQDSSGNGVPAVTVTAHLQTTDALLGTFTDAGGGQYYLDLSQTQKIKIKENGTVKLQNYLFAADDFYPASVYASTGGGTPGASLIGFSDDDGRWSSNNLQTALDGEIASLLELGSTAAGKGASLIGVQDAEGHYTASNLEALLQEVGARLGQISGLTASAAELNKLDGANADVTAANLNTIFSGAVTALHKHNVLSWYDDKIGPQLNPGQVSGPISFRVFSYNSAASGPRGNIILDVYDPDGSGRVVVRRGNDSDAQTDYDLISRYEFGDFNLLSNPIFAGITNLTDALLVLANNIRAVQVSQGTNYTIFNSGGTSAAATDGAAAADPRATTLYYDKSAGYVIKRRWAIVQQPGMRTIELDSYFKGDTAGTSWVKLVVGGLVEQEYKITGTAYGKATLSVLLDSIAVSTPTPLDVEIYMKGDGAGHGGFMSAWFQLRATH